MSLDSLFDQFIRERIYIRNVTPATREWYETAWQAFKTSRTNSWLRRQARIHAIVAALLDTGCRTQELLSARTADFDFDQLLLTVTGKGRKERREPFSMELRKVLFRLGQVKAQSEIGSDLMFPAIGAIVVRLSIILGHSDVSTTMKYLHWLTTLQTVSSAGEPFKVHWRIPIGRPVDPRRWTFAPVQAPDALPRGGSRCKRRYPARAHAVRGAFRGSDLKRSSGAAIICTPDLLASPGRHPGCASSRAARAGRNGDMPHARFRRVLG